MSASLRLLVGTTKGLFVYSSDTERRHWELSGPHVAGWEVYAVLGAGERLLAGSSHVAYGPSIRVSDDQGESWTEVAGSPAYSEASGFSLKRIWQISPGHASQPDTLYAGVDEAGLFVSQDRGLTWTELDALTAHPTRPGWYPGLGGLCLHTVLVDPRELEHLIVGISAVGVFISEDGGRSWRPSNAGLARVPTGQPYPDVGYCVHKMVFDPEDPDTIYMQEHGGVLVSSDCGASWTPAERGLPSERISHGPDAYSGPFGFPIAVSATGDVFVVPAESSEQRMSGGGRMVVYRLERGTDTWTAAGTVSPDEPQYGTVLRDSLVVDGLDPYGVYVGTTGGEIYGSLDRGETWTRLPGHLPRVTCLKLWTSEAGHAS